MPSPNVPDVRVRLSAEGEKQVVDAMKRVVAASNRAGKDSARGFAQFNDALKGAQSLLAGLAAAAGTGALIALGKEAADAADQLGKMAQRVGASVESLSALRFAAATADVSMEQLQTAFVVFNRQTTALTAGSKEAKGAFDALGISARDLAGLDAAERLSLVAEAFGKLEDSPAKTALAFQVFGKQAANLIPLLNDLSEDGLQGAIDKAREFGVLLSEDTARAAQAINDDFTIIKEQVLAGAARFVEGFAPAVHAALGFVQDDLGKNQVAWKEWGAAVGHFIAITILTADSLIDRMITSLRKLANAAVGIGQALGAALRDGLNVGASELIKQERSVRDQNNRLEAEFRGREQERGKRAEDVGFAATRGAASLPKLRAQGQGDEAPVVPVTQTAKHEKRREIATGQRPFTQQEALREQVNETELAFKELDTARASIEQRVQAGLESEASGRVRLLELEKQRLPILQAQATALLAAAQAAGDPDAISRALQFGEAVQQIAVNVEAADALLKRIGATAEDALQSALQNLFTTGIEEAKNFTEALQGVALAVVNAIRQLLAAELAALSLKALRGVLAGFSGGGAVEAAEGGLITGPGTGTSDSINAALSAGEFVVRAAVVEQPGMLEALHSINEGLGTPALATVRRARRFADGGLVGGAGATGLSGTVTVALEDGLVARHIEQPAGQRAVIRAIGKQPRGVGAAIGG